MKRKLLIRDLTLRDGQQSQLATRMNQNQVDRTLPFYRDANFWALEVWGGAVPDSTMRYLGENPWERLGKIKAALDGTTLLTALSRGRNLFGYNPYPEETIEGFNRNALETGVDIMRIFDALNDIDNMKSTIEIVRKNGGQTDCAVCYTTDPQFTFWQRVKGALSGKPLPKAVFTVEYFVKKALELEALGANIITMKDMAGLIQPHVAGELYRELKKRVKVPVNHHSHCTPGYGLGSALVAVMNGADIVDTVIMNFAGGPAAPAFELLQIFCDKLDIDTGVNLEAVAKINRELKGIREELSAFDKSGKLPKPLDLTTYKIPAEVDELFDRAIEAGEKERYADVVRLTQGIEAYFDFPGPNEIVKEAQIPGGMYSNMVAQLETMGMSELYDEVLRNVPRVRLDSGLPPLVTPTSQIVGVQAVNSVVGKAQGKEFYDMTSAQFVSLVRGGYGKTPIPIDPKFREMITGSPEEVPYDTSGYEKPENPVIEDLGVQLAEDEKEMLLLELFPSVAAKYLETVKHAKFDAEQSAISDQEDRERAEEFARLLNGIEGNYQLAHEVYSH
ncbi:MAG TPA: carboxylase [candidate division Zixibacteria bacterium]|nr:carboxylase [candidate division Zixibacteria bacterium]